jgi:hypothetical protein
MATNRKQGHKFSESEFGKRIAEKKTRDGKYNTIVTFLRFCLALRSSFYSDASSGILPKNSSVLNNSHTLVPLGKSKAGCTVPTTVSHPYQH